MCLLYGSLSGNIQFYILKNFRWFLGGAKVWVKKSFVLPKGLKIDIG